MLSGHNQLHFGCGCEPGAGASDARPGVGCPADSFPDPPVSPLNLDARPLFEGSALTACRALDLLVGEDVLLLYHNISQK